MRDLKKLIFALVLLCGPMAVNGQKSAIVDSLTVLLQQNPGDSATVMLKTVLAREYIYVDIAKANKLIQEAFVLAEESKLEHEKAYAMRIMGAILRENGFYMNGAELLLEARSIFEKYNDKLGQANCYLSLAHIYDYIGDKDLAMGAGRKALKLFEEVGVKERLGVITNNLGRSYSDAGNLDSARYFIHRSLVVNSKTQNLPLLQSNYRNLGIILHKLGQNDSAKYYLNKVIALDNNLQKQSNSWATAEANLTLAKIYVESGKYADVPYNLQRARQLSAKFGYLSMLKEVMEVSFNFYSKINDHTGLVDAWNRYQTISDSLLSLERQNKRHILDWYEDRLAKETEIEAAYVEVERQRTQIITMGVIIAFSIVILVLIIGFNRRINKTKNKLSLQKEELENLNHTKNKLFSIVAHDFRSPLAHLSGFANLITDHWEQLDSNDMKKLAGDMSQSVNNTLALTENLLSWARNQMDGHTSNPTDFDVKELLGELVSQIQNMASHKGIQLQLEVKESISLYADPEELRVAFRNLITNAIKFSSAGDHVLVRAFNKGDSVHVTVKDEGIGMEQEVVDGLFSLGEKTGSKGTAGEMGSGLGLTLCKEFVNQNGGTIKVQSTPGEGSTFDVSFPKS